MKISYSRSPKTARNILIPIGLVFLILGIYFTIKNIQEYNNLQETTGTITGYKTESRMGSNNFNRIYYYDKIEFIDTSGNRMDEISSIGYNNPDHSIGDKVNVFYSKDHPENMVIDSLFNIWIETIIFFGISIIALPIGIIAWIAASKRN